MNKGFKFISVILWVLTFTTVAIIICYLMQINSKADGNSLVRDTNLSVDSGGKLVIKRNKINQIPMGKENSWTIFIYMCGSDLESLYGDATSDIKEMINSEISDNVNIIIQTGGSRFWHDTGMSSTEICRYEVKDEGVFFIEKKANASMGYSETLKDFLNWGVNNYAAEHMGVVFWNHGGGSIDGICFDEKYNDDSLKLVEVEKAFNSVSKKMTDKFEFVGFDACLMSTVETANMLAPYSNYMIASEETEPNCGWNYTPIVNTLSQNPDIEPEALGKTIIDSYFDVVEGKYAFKEGTMSLVNLNEIDNVLVEFNTFCKNLNEKTNSLSDITNYTKVANNSDNYGGNNQLEGYSNMVDMGDFVKNMGGYINGDKVLAAINKAVAYQKKGTGHAKATGLAMYYPLKVEGMETFNILRNIAISPYYMEYLDKVLYASSFKSLDGFSSNNWTSSEYFYDKDFYYLDVMFNSAIDYVTKYMNNEYYKKASFDNKWYSWISGLNIGGNISSDEPSNTSSDTSSGALNNSLIEYLESLDNPELTGPIIEWFNGQKSIDITNNKEKVVECVSAEYQIVVPNGNSVSVLGTIGNVNNDLEQLAFDGKWFAFNDGQFIQAKLIEEGNGLSLYTSPAIVDGKDVTIRFVADKDKNVLVLGAWDGIDENGCSGKGYRKIESGSVVTPVYTTINPSTGEVTKENGVKMTVSDGKLIVSNDVKSYTTIVELVDAFGNVTYTTIDID